MEQTAVVSRESRRQEWQRHVAGWRCSGLKVSAYCAANGLDAGQFWYWRRALTTRMDENKGFVELPVRSHADSELTVEIGRAAIRIREGFDGALLRRVVDCLSAS